MAARWRQMLKEKGLAWVGGEKLGFLKAKINIYTAFFFHDRHVTILRCYFYAMRRFDGNFRLS